MRKTKLKAAFTLLELCICIAILSLSGVFIGWQVKGAIEHERFESSLQRLESELHTLQLLSMSYQTDLSLTLSFKEGKALYQITTDDPILSFGTSLKDTPERPLGGILSFKLPKKPENQKIQFTFFSSGRIIPQDIVEIKGKRGSVWLDLRQPLQIKIEESYPKKININLPQRPFL